MSAENEPVVTVLVPSYNHSRYIESCIKSISEQTYKNLEVLVVDDGSTDGSVELIGRLQDLYDFEFKAQANKGLIRTLNEGLLRAQGVYFVPFASDDIMLPRRIELQVKHMQANPEVGICGGNIIPVDVEGRVVGKRKRLHPARRLDFDSLFRGGVPGAPAPSMLLRRDVALQVGGYDPAIGIEDLTIMLKVSKVGYFVDVLAEELALYRTHPENMHKNLRFMMEEVLKIYALFADHPDYERVCMAHRNSMLLKAAKQDKALALDIFRQLPVRFWTRKTMRSILYLMLMHD